MEQSNSSKAPAAHDTWQARCLRHLQRVGRLVSWFDLTGNHLREMAAEHHQALAAQGIIPPTLAACAEGLVMQGRSFSLSTVYPETSAFPSPAVSMFPAETLDALWNELHVRFSSAETEGQLEALAAAALQFALLHVSPQASSLQLFHLLKDAKGKDEPLQPTSLVRAFHELEMICTAWLRGYMAYEELPVKGRIMLKYWLQFGIHTNWKKISGMQEQYKHLLTSLVIRPDSTLIDLARILELPKQQVLEMLKPFVDGNIIHIGDDRRINIVMA